MGRTSLEAYVDNDSIKVNPFHDRDFAAVKAEYEEKKAAAAKK
tara:strand:- start:103 stop:231 length:129 start_codon:yes stop_codon:yes gene_type:complete